MDSKKKADAQWTRYRVVYVLTTSHSSMLLVLTTILQSQLSVAVKIYRRPPFTST